MESKKQTTVTDKNRKDFFQILYWQSTLPKAQLVQLDEYKVSNFVMVDCCSWHYKTLWPTHNVIGLETLNTIKNFKLDKTKFQAIVDDRNYADIKWPSVDVNDCALIFDHSPILKYKTLDDIASMILSASMKYKAKVIVIRSNTAFLDDCRFVDRFSSLAKLTVPNYVVTKFLYDVHSLRIDFRKKVHYDLETQNTH